MNKKFFKAFTMAETLITLSLIGILAITMVSLNNLSGNDTKIATAKLTQLDSALQAWGKAVTKSNETGLGAAQTLTDQAALDQSLTNFLNTHGVDGNATINVNNQDYSGHSIQINKDINIEVAFLSNGNNAIDGYEYNDGLALLTATASSGKASVSNSYLMGYKGLENLDTKYEGWEKYEVVKVGTVYMFCPGLDSCSAGCTDSSSTGCVETTLNVPYIFVEPTSVIACGSGQTGTIKKLTISDGAREYNAEIDTCCPSPQVYSGLDENGKKLCSCPSTFVPDSGYGIDFTSTTCQKACERGQYSNGRDCVLCAEKSYCPTEKMTASKSCEAGHYCPNSTDIKDKANYHSSKYIYNENNQLTEVKNYGLINEVPCTVGNYCPNTGMNAPTTCPKGYYCPQEGLVQPIPCPAGTYGDELGATAKSACKPCEDGKYQDQVGQTSCKPCANGSTPSADKTSCEICKAGTYYDENANACEPCPKGHKCPTAGLKTPTPCNCGTYQPYEGKTECYDVPVGAYATKKVDNVDTYANSAATTATICPAGHSCAGGCNNKSACAQGTYQNLTGQNSCKTCSCGTYQPNAGQTGCINVSAGYYPTKDGSYINSAATAATICPAGYSCAGGCPNKVACTPGHYQDLTGQTSCNNCPVGHECPNTAMTAPTACECGTYQPNAGQTACNIVNAGYYPTKEGSYINSAATAATICPTGHSCAGACNNKSACAKGTYQNETGKNTCKNCGCGYQTNSLTGTGATSCTQCNTLKNDSSGYYYSKPADGVACTKLENKEIYKDTTKCTKSDCTGNYVANSEHTQCVCGLSSTGLPAGKYVTSDCKYACDTTKHFVVSGDTCVCDKGYYLNGTTCSPCAAGYYKNSQSNSACTACSCGTYQPNEGQTSCNTVNAGYYPTKKINNVDTYVNSAATTATICPAGSSCAGGCSNKVACSAGHYQNLTGKNSCNACSCGTYQPNTGQTACISVGAGYYPTKDNSYVNSAATTATICPAGHSCAGGCNNKVACPIGTYQGSTGQNFCTTCGCGYQTNNVMGTGATSCTQCSTYQYSKPADGVACTQLTNKQRYTDTTKCTKTDCIGNYVSNSDHTQCICGLSTTGLPVGKYVTSDCQYACDTANHFVASGSSCVCESGYYLNGSTCSPCYNHSYITYTLGTTSCSSTSYIQTCTTPYVAVNNTEYLCGQTPTADAAKPADIVSNTCLSKSIYVFSLNLTGKDDGNSSAAANRSLACTADMTGYTSIGSAINKSGDWSFYSDKSAAYCYNTENYNDKSCTNAQKTAMTKPVGNVKYYIIIDKKVVAYYTVSGTWVTVDSGISSISANITQGTTKITDGVHGGTNYELTGTVTINGCTHNITAGRYRHASPLVLDLKGNGLKFTNIKNGVNFDLDGDGNAEQVSWTTEQKEFDNAFLCLDKNGNGQIDSGKELFGDQYGEESGFEELAKYDDNGDGVITKDDAIYEKLQLWCDMNKNGKVDDGELKKLADERVSEVSTKYTKQYDENGNIQTDENGNITGFVGTFKHIVEEVVDGVTTLVEKIGEMIDVFFQMIKSVFE